MLRGLPLADVRKNASRILDAGFLGMGLDHPFHAFQWEEVAAVLPRGSIVAVQLFLPYPNEVRPGAGCPFALGRLHPEEKRDALAQGRETILFAERSSIPTILVSPVTLDDLRGELQSKKPDLRHEPVRERILGLRKAEAARRIDSFRSVLSRLLDEAGRYAVRLAILPGGLLDEAPSLEEAAGILKEFHGAPLVVCLDLLRTTIGEDARASLLKFLEAVGSDCAGALLKDGQDAQGSGSQGARPLDWEGLRPVLEACPVWLADESLTRECGGLAETLQFLERLATASGPQVRPGGDSWLDRATFSRDAGRAAPDRATPE